MAGEDWEAIIAAGETHTVEFKSDRTCLSDQDLVEAVTCLANGSGGLLFVGVEDDGSVTGLHKDHCQRSDLLPSLVASRTVPPLSVGVEVISLGVNTGVRQVAVIRVPVSEQIIATSDGRTLVRYMDSQGNPGCRPLYPHEFSSWRASRGSEDVSALPVSSASEADLDPLEFVRLRRMVETHHGDAALSDLSDRELARALGLVATLGNQVVPTMAGLLLVGRETALREYIPTHEVAFQVLEGTDVVMNDFYKQPLLRVVERILEGFELRNDERELNVGLFRVGIPAYDRRAFREALSNALVHRDYHRLGAVHIQLRDDRIVIQNPGGFVEGVRADNLLHVGPHPRNPCLADCFKRIGLVERTGRGVNIIYRGQLRNGRRPPSYERSTEVSVSVTLYGGPANLDFVQLVLAHENDKGRMLGVGELLVLNRVFYEREIDTATVARIVQLPQSDARALLEKLVEEGLLEKRGNRRSRTYHLSAGIYRELGEPAAYVRTHGFERPQMKQMILQYVRVHGRIARRNVMDLCHLDQQQAFYVLSQLVEEGLLRLVGWGRGAHYVIEDAGSRGN
jgi:ATP-dependent DNA helicase RecG